MALGLYFTPSSFTPAVYDDALRRLEAAGAGAPAGRLHHVALESDGLIQVFDVWESQESFEAFGATLLPIMAELGADPGQPMISPVYNMIDGERRVERGCAGWLAGQARSCLFKSGRLTRACRGSACAAQRRQPTRLGPGAGDPRGPDAESL